MARGGTRKAAPGQPKGQRTDMNQPVRVITGQAYGQAQALENAQRAIPLPNNAAAPAASASSAPTMQPGPPAIPGQNEFARPTERPTEPVTAGLPTGPGPGPEALTTMSAQAPDTIGQQLRALYAQEPNNDLLRLIELHDRGY